MTNTVIKTENIYTKILRASANFDAIVKDKTNPFYSSKYADLNSIITAVEKALNDEGLLLLQPMSVVNGVTIVSTMIVDTVNETQVSSSMSIPANITDPQKLGAASTYMRRFTLKGLLGLPEEDDDGNSLSETKRETKTFAKPAAKMAVAQVATTTSLTANGTNGSTPSFKNRRQLGTAPTAPTGDEV